MPRLRARDREGELRFGESLPNPYAEGDALYWFHVPCAACMRPEKLLPALEIATEPVPDTEWLRETAAFGVAHRRVPRIARVERASSGRAKCRHCHHLIDKGVFRIALQMFEEGRMNPIGYIHVRCSDAYFGTRDLLDRIVRLTPELAPEDTGELSRALAEEPLPRLEEGAEGAPDATEAPGLAKAHAPPATDADAADEPQALRTRR